MQSLTRRLARCLKQLQVSVDHTEQDDTLLRHVPAHEGHFSKASTNVLLKHVPDRAATLVLVDVDIEYTGENAEIARLFASGWHSAGWKALFLEPDAPRSRDNAIKRILNLLGAEGQDPVLDAPAPPAAARDAAKAGLVAGISDNLTQQGRAGNGWPCLGRDEVVIEVASCIRRWGEARLALVVGESGTGKTALLHGVAAVLAARAPETELFVLNLERLFSGAAYESERENLLSALFQDMQEHPQRILALEHAELAVCDMRYGPLLLANALDRGIALAGLILPRYQRFFLDAPLRRRVHVITLDEPPYETAVAMAAAHAPAIAAHHGVTIDSHLAHAATAAAEPLPGALPGKAITLLDAAAARAAVKGVAVVGLEDIYFAARRAQACEPAQDEES